MASIGEAGDMRQVMFTNLQLLGLDASAMEKTWRIPFNKDMFDLPNKKGFEAVMHFLFERLNPTKCKEEFRYCWLVQDRKQEHQFRKVCNSWLTSISENDEDAHLPRIVASIFMSPGGHRFIQLLFSFSQYVLYKSILDENGVKSRDVLRYPSLCPRLLPLANVTHSSLQCGTVRHRQRFLDNSQRAVSTQEQWKQYAAELVKCYRGLSRTLRELEHELKAEVHAAVDKGKARGSPVAHKKRRSGTLEYDYDLQAIKRAQKVRKVRELWKQLGDFRSGMSSQKEVIECILDRELDKYRLDAGELNIKVPDMLLRDCEQEIQRRNVDNIYQGGKLNILSLIHLWNLSLHSYIEKLNAHGMGEYKGADSSVTTQMHTHNAHLANAEALRTKIEVEMIPQLKSSIDQLKQKLDRQMFRSQSPETIRLTSVGLGLMPPTPPMTFDPATLAAETPKGGHDPRFSEQLARPGENVSTPEAASQLMAAIAGKMKKQQTVTQGSPAYHNPRRSEIPTKQSRVDDLKTDHQSKQRIRNKSAPTHGPTSFTVSMDIAGELSASRATPSAQTHAAKHTLTEQATRHKAKVREQHEKITRKPPRAAKKSSSSKQAPKKASPTVVRHDNVIASFTQTPRAHRQLADQIADAVVSGNEELVHQLTERLRDSATLLESDAFVSRSKIANSPPTSQPSTSTTTRQDTGSRHPPAGTHSPGAAAGGSIPGSRPGRPDSWHSRLLAGQDSMGGPLSSTHLADQDTVTSSKRSSSHVDNDKLFSPQISDVEDEIVTVAANPSPRPSPAPHRSPKSNMYHPAPNASGRVPGSPLSLHSGWSSPGQASPHPQRSPHGSRSFIRSPPPMHSSSNSTGPNSTGPSTPSLADPRTGDLFAGMDSSEGSGGGGAVVQVQEREPTELSMTDRKSNLRHLPPTGSDTSLEQEQEYLTLIATDTPKLPSKSRSNQNNVNNVHIASDNEMSGEEQMLSLMTMTPAAGRKFAQQSARIVAFQDDLDNDDLLEERSRSVTPEDELMRRSLTGESEVEEDVVRNARTLKSPNGSALNGLVLSQQADDLLDFGITMEQQLRQAEEANDELLISFEDNKENSNCDSSSSGADSLVERYKRLREKENSDSVRISPQKNADAADQLRSRLKQLKQAAGLPTSPATVTINPALGNQYLKRTPQKQKVKEEQQHANKFTLDLDFGAEEDENRDAQPVTKEWLSSGLLDDEDYSDVLLATSPFGTPTVTPKGTPAKIGTPNFGLKLSSIPMSPLTDTLHRDERHSSSNQLSGITEQHWQDILGEDASILVPSSPTDQQH